MLFSKAQKNAILFADISGSSALYKAQGNESAKQLIDGIFKLLSKSTFRHQGRVVKTIGDEVMAAFPSVELACLAAVDMQNNVEQVAHSHGLGLRVGIGFGKTLKDGDDLFGEAVNDAAFVTGIAKATQILLTESVVEQLSDEMKPMTQAFDQVTLKGGSKRSTIYRMFWKTPSAGFSETQVFSIDAVNSQIDKARMSLSVDEQAYEITPTLCPFVLGRNTSNSSLAVDSELVSRDHCHIVFRRGKFVLIDHSTNGTYIKPDEAKEIYLRREELPLLGSGSISLGVSHQSSNSIAIKFSV